MKRPLFVFSIALAFGVTIAYLSNSFLTVIISIIAIFFICIIINFRKSTLLFISVGIIIFYAFGAIEYLYVTNSNTYKFKEFSGQQVVVKGYIDSEADVRETKTSYVIKTTEIEYEGKSEKIKGKILFTTLRNDNLINYGYGSLIQVKGLLNTPKGKRNPGGFDYRRYLAQSGVSATIFANSDCVSIGDSKSAGKLKVMGLAIRKHIVEVINKTLPPEQAGLLNGMLIGYRDGLSKDVQKAFSDSGLTHIMAVSGMNVAFIVMPMVFIFKKLRFRKNIANIIIIGILVMFVFITGFSPSVVRAVIMAVIILMAQIIRREADVVTSLSLAAIILILYNPITLLDVGFQLSFAATISLVMFYKNIKKAISFKFIPNSILDVLAVTLAAQVGVIPITAFYFNNISLISVLSNIFVVPLAEVITILGFAMAILGQINIFFAQIIGYINCSFLSFILFISKTASSVPYAVLKVATPPLLLILVYYILAFFFLWYRPRAKVKIKLKKIYYFGFAVILFSVICVYVFLPKGLEIVFLDVGQGDATFIRTCTGKTILIDGGGSDSRLKSETNIGDTTIIPFLLDYGVTKLDLVIATHAHDDHIQGLIPVLKSFNVKTLIIPGINEDKDFKALTDITSTRRIKVESCVTGDTIRLDRKTYFEVLFPELNNELGSSTLNNTSLVLKLRYIECSILFTGDIEKAVEDELMKNKMSVKADILKVAHHGSISSTRPEFLKLINPSAAVISVGKNNFGHPAAEVIESLTENKVQIFRTDECGAIILKSDGVRITVKRTIRR